MLYCTLDIGTSSIKCALIRADGGLAGTGKVHISLVSKPSGAFEVLPAEWPAAASRAIAVALAAAGERASAISAVAVSGNGPTLVPVGGDGSPLGNALSWMDRRPETQARRVSGLSGKRIDAGFYLPKVLYLTETDPAFASRVSWWFSGPEYLSFALSGSAVSYLPNPYYEPYIWNLPVALALGLDSARFPPYVEPAARIGYVTSGAERDFGIPARTPVVSGFPDFLAALVGSGAMAEGIACDRAGTSEALNLCAGRPFPDETLFSLPHPVKGKWNVSGGVSTSGKAFEWYASLAGYGDVASGAFEAAAASVEPGAGGVIFLPFLGGERAPLWERDLRAGFLGVGTGHGREHLARAVLESVAYGLKLTADIARGNGFPFDLVRASGAAAGNGLLCAIKADALELPVEVPENHACETAGDACACAVALGAHGDLAEASIAMTRIARRYDPDPRRGAVYRGMHEAFREAVEASLRVSRLLARPGNGERT